MKEILGKFKIPTVLGLGIIIAGIITGVTLTLREQIFTSKASPSSSAQNITLTNLTDTEVTISWQTSIPIPSFITFGNSSPHEQTVLDDRDSKSPQPHSIHYVTLKNLLPKTTYQYKIISGKTQSEISEFTTAAPLSEQTGFRPIIGPVLDKDKPLNEGVVYLLIDDATTQSALIADSGNFLIPISQIRTADLSDLFPLTEDILAKLTIVSAKGQTNVLFPLGRFDKGLPPIKLGQDLDLTDGLTDIEDDLGKYDLNSDGKINTADNAIILQNFGKDPQDKRADLNQDGIVDQTDLDLMAKQINQ